MKYHLIDAKGKILGRIATQAALLLCGKKKTGFVPAVDNGDAVIVINSDEVRLSGLKSKKKIYHRFSGFPSGIKSITFENQMKKDSRLVVFSAVYGMLPKNKLRKGRLKKLRVYKDANHPHKIT